MQTLIVILIVAIATAFLIRNFLKKFKQEDQCGCGCAAPPAPRIRHPVKKIQKTLSWIKFTGCTE
jgi:hypothetical protein